LGFRATVWQQRRHDYAQLLVALSKRDPEEILKRLELVALVGPPAVRQEAVAVKMRLLARERADPVAADEVGEWHSAMFDLMRRDIDSWSFPWHR
jgi:hypothetical protein